MRGIHPFLLGDGGHSWKKAADVFVVVTYNNYNSGENPQAGWRAQGFLLPVSVMEMTI